MSELSALQHFGIPANDKTEYFLTIPAVGNEVFAENVALVEEIGDSLVMPISKFIDFVNTNLDPEIRRHATVIQVAVATNCPGHSTNVPNVSGKAPVLHGLNAWYEYD